MLTQHIVITNAGIIRWRHPTPLKRSQISLNINKSNVQMWIVILMVATNWAKHNYVHCGSAADGTQNPSKSTSNQCLVRIFLT